MSRHNTLASTENFDYMDYEAPQQESHVCVLDIETFDESVFPPIDSKARFGKRLKRFLTKLTTLSPEFRAKGILRSRVIQEAAARLHVNSVYWYVFHPYCMFLRVWVMIMLIAYLTELIILPVNASYPNTLLFLKLAQVPLDVLFCLDVLVNMNTGYVVEMSNEIELKSNVIIKSYLRTYFIGDLISSIPGTTMIGNDLETRFVWNLLKLLKIIRVRTIRHSLQEFLTHINVDDRHIDLVCLFTHTIFLILWIGCADLISDNITAVYFSTSIELAPKIHFDSFIFLMSDASSKVMGGAIMNVPENMTATIAGALGVLLGYFNYLFLQVMILNFIICEFAVRTEFQGIMNQLRMYMTANEIPLPLQKRLEEYYHYKFQDKFFHEDVVMAMLSNNLNRDLKMHFSRHMIESVNIFANLPISVLEMIMERLRPVILSPNEYLMRAGARGDCMYFLVNGTVAVYTPNGKEVCHLEDGSYFGEIALLKRDNRRVASVIAVEFCEVFRLDAVEFRKCVVASPELSERLRMVAFTRQDVTESLEEAHLHMLRRGKRKRNALRVYV